MGSRLIPKTGENRTTSAPRSRAPLLNAWVKFRAYGPLYLAASYTRTWHIQEDGSYLAEGDFNVGFSLAFTY